MSEKKHLSDNADRKIINGFYKGSLLVSTPDILDPRFSRSVIYLISHNEKGAMGFIINKPIDDIQLSDIIKKENSSKNIAIKKNTLFFLVDQSSLKAVFYYIQLNMKLRILL